MMTFTARRTNPFAPLVLDDAGSLEAMAAAVMRLHSTLIDGRALLYDRRHGRPGHA